MNQLGGMPSIEGYENLDRERRQVKSHDADNRAEPCSTRNTVRRFAEWRG